MTHDEARATGPFGDPLGDPFAGVLDAAQSWPEAAAYEVPVGTIRRRVRRRRAARRAAAGGGACVLAAGVVVAVQGDWRSPSDAVSYNLPIPGDDSGSAASGSGDAGAVADWPAQFDRCGKPLAEPAHPTELTITASSIGADAVWHATTEAGRPPGTTPTLLGTDVSLVRDGVVVAVQEGVTVPEPDGPTTAEPGYSAGAFRDVTHDVTAHLASCAQYPDGQGSAVVEPGTYELVAVQSLAMTGLGGSWTQQALARTTVTVPAS